LLFELNFIFKAITMHSVKLFLIFIFDFLTINFIIKLILM